MRWLGVAAAVLLVTAIAEVAAFVLVAKAIGVGWALVAGVVTTVLGGWLLRREGVRGWRRFRSALQEGRPPGAEASDGLAGLTGAFLLVLPGFVTDLVGLLLLVPPIRRLTGRGIRVATERRVSSAVAGGVFGPRRVRAYRGPAAADQPAPPATTPRDPGGHADADAIEGTIVEDPHPDRRP
jgi:UPF0716 protein FxsA